MDYQDLFKKLSSGAKFRQKESNCVTPSVKKEKPIDTKMPHEERISRLRNLNNISVTGKNIPEPIESFDHLFYDNSEIIIKNILSNGYTTPTPIQMQVIPAMMKERQIMACAPTGSGKTAAFLLPLICLLSKPSRKGFRALILCPTRELARQIYRECLHLSTGTGLKTHIITKVSQNSNKFGQNFSSKFDILISTPNRLIYLMRKEEKVICLENLEWLIVDESDKLFETGVRGFRDQLGEIYTSCNANVKRAMFSATYTVEVAKWCKQNLKNLICVTIGHRNTTADIKQELIYVGNESGKITALRNLIHEGITPPVLIFVQSKERAKQLFNELIYDEISVDVIHSDRTQLQRDNVVKAFREGKVWVLVCTELMGRGIDFKGIKLVINYDFPPSAISYIHRIGRTGRAGRPGKAITYFTGDDKPMLRSIARVMKDSGCPVPEYMLSLKKIKRSERKKMENQAPDRKPISTAIGYEKHKQNKLKRWIAQSKEKKQKKETQNNN